MAKAKATATKANAKTGRTSSKKAATPKTQDTAPVEVPETKEIAEVPEVPEKFESMCGFEFDAAAASSCATTCSVENPEAYAACLANFKSTPKKSTRKATGKRRGKNQWGHLIGCQGELIDQCFLTTGGAHSMKEIMEQAKATRPRVVSHLKHLVSVWKVDLRVTEDNKYFIEGLKSDGLVGKKSNGTKIVEEETAKAA